MPKTNTILMKDKKTQSWTAYKVQFVKDRPVPLWMEVKK